MRERRTGNGVAGITDIECFSRLLRGRVVAPPTNETDATYWTGRAWVRTRPRLIVYCRGPFDVIEAVRYANARDLRIAVRASGEEAIPSASADDAIVADLTPMKRVAVDVHAGRIIAEAGASSRAFDEQAYQNGLVAPSSMIAATSMADVTLNGEHGWLSRRDGLACDALCAANLVTPQGDYTQVDDQHGAELFWAIRGGGPNFGIVTSLIYRARAVQAEMFGGSVSYPINALQRVVDFYFAVVVDCDDEITLRLILAEVGGQSACTLQVLSRQSHGDNATLTAALRQLAVPLVDTLGAAPYPAFRQMLGMPSGRRVDWPPAAWVSHITADMSASAAKTAFLAWLVRWPAKQCVVVLDHLGGQISRIPNAATAFSHRDARFRLLVGLVSRAPQDGAAVAHFENGLLSALGADVPHDASRAASDRRIDACRAYAGNYNRLARIKRIDDPDGRLVGNGLFDHLYR